MMAAVVRKRLLILALAALACGVWHGCGEPEADLAPAPAEAAEHAGHNHPPDKPHAMPGDGASIAIQVVQGTSGGRPVTGGTVSVDLFRPEHRVETIEAELDEHGVVLLEGLSLASQFEPRVSFVRDGISFEASGERMSPQHSHQKITVNVYEITEQEPDWSISMQYVLAYPVAGGVYVEQMMVVENPSDRAWLSAPDADGVRSSISLRPPAGFEELRLFGEFHDRYSSVVEGRLISHRPMLPGPKRHRLHYIVPGQDDQVKLDLVSTAPITSMIVSVPHEYRGMQTADMTESGVYNVFGEPMTAYKAGDIPAGRPVTLTFTDLPDAHEHVAGRQAEGGSTNAPKILAAIVCGIMLIVCMVVLLLKPAKKTNAGPAK